MQFDKGLSSGINDFSIGLHFCTYVGIVLFLLFLHIRLHCKIQGLLNKNRLFLKEDAFLSSVSFTIIKYLDENCI